MPIQHVATNNHLCVLVCVLASMLLSGHACAFDTVGVQQDTVVLTTQSVPTLKITKKLPSALILTGSL